MTTAVPRQLVSIPGLSGGDVATVAGILKGRGVFVRVVTHAGDGTPFDEVLVWESDVPKVRRVLAGYRVRGDGGELTEIPW